jgi:hypothetical protein
MVKLGKRPRAIVISDEESADESRVVTPKKMATSSKKVATPSKKVATPSKTGTTPSKDAKFWVESTPFDDATDV